MPNPWRELIIPLFMKNLGMIKEFTQDQWVFE